MNKYHIRFRPALAGGVAIAGLLAALTGCGRSDSDSILYGNVDDRELQLSFVLSERVAQVIPEEGTFVKKGDVIARLETVRIENDRAVQKEVVAVMEAKLAAAKAAMEKSDNGSRKEEIQQSRELVSGLLSRVATAKVRMERAEKLVPTGGVSQQHYDDSVAMYDTSRAELGAETNRLSLLIEGDRAEDRAITRANLAEANAELLRAKADLAVVEQRLRDCVLVAPGDGVIRERLLEPGEWTSPLKPVCLLALTDPKWVRCYLREPQLAKFKLNHKALVKVDGREKPFEGWIGYISPTAEFTPKNIETDELRPTLMYETRVYVKDPEGCLKLGAPVVVELQ